MAKVEVLDAKAMERALRRIAHEILERNGGAERLTLIGIRRRGVPLARRLARFISDLEKLDVPCADLDIRDYRDDRLPDCRPHRHPAGLSGRHPEERSAVQAQTEGDETEADAAWSNVPVADRVVVLVDDVLYTGRTVRAAMDALIERGRPAAIQLAVLIDRGHRELPIRPDFVGKNLPTSRHESVDVLLFECDGEEKVQITEGASR